MRRSPLATLLLAALVLPACLPRTTIRPPPPPSLTSVANALFESVENEGTMASVFLVDAATGTPLYARHEHVRLLPASTMKVVSTSAALAAFGPDFRFHTPVRLEGSQLGNLFLGDLVVEASGDPSLGSWRFPETAMACEQVAEALQARGIRQWLGAVRVSNADEGPYGLFGPGWAWDDAAYAYSAAPTPFVFRENVVDLSLERPEGQDCNAQPRRPIVVRYSPSFNELPTVVYLEPNAQKAGLGCVRERGSGRMRCVWRSTAEQCPQKASMRVAIDEPRALFTSCVEDSLAARGIWRVPVPPHLAAVPEVATSEPLLDFTSPSLAELVKVTNKESLNLYAERLGLRFTRERTGTESYPALREAMAQELARRGIPTRLLRPVDGSGLSRYNVATARGLAEVIYTSLKEPYASALLESLPVAGVDGTLASSAVSNGTRGLIRAKTGTLSGQKAYVGIAERPNDPEHPRVVFALMLGNIDDQPALTASQVFEQFAEAMVSLPLR
ncbi:D-alanyl-D-alanine carboxypeptidase/D-alanyl-D-alanine-endopeptidase [Vitiosangium sp. GDMCC 1.1324]|uniref:D-alanyl-D-alanine carboxypeptidase/D-alanyl-D-alanine endopeptidase n=1 Tax=Vitiosangium sp. (strain GDMCC 1.1324) TaxID=2138576 RepID=UPI000D36DB10|nr:D-alanyl-D-alanine carboxypeptidase/D-alanyl-D-alanine-endopeptidase [Vitiosangium sp. GDMCC 1.1324]PTL85547.1 D-alanyl-D-alanine carboxypeptidase/D-alanyl-D-alanine-endopeptidase [Vitiosangium sp. GDMCC 1.1324]